MKTIIKWVLLAAIALPALVILVMALDVQGQAEQAGSIQGPALPQGWIAQAKVA